MINDDQSRVIFISYRRTPDEAVAILLQDVLARRLPKMTIFMDHDTPSGMYRERLLNTVKSCRAAVFIIGPGWYDVKSDCGIRRLEVTDDMVREEILAALDAGVPIVPLTLPGAEAPTAKLLPKDLQRFSLWQAYSLERKSDIELLATRLREIMLPIKRGGVTWLFGAALLLAYFVSGVHPLGSDASEDKYLGATLLIGPAFGLFLAIMSGVFGWRRSSVCASILIGAAPLIFMMLWLAPWIGSIRGFSDVTIAYSVVPLVIGFVLLHGYYRKTE